MDELSRFVERIVARLSAEDAPDEEPDLEVKSAYPSVAEAESLWSIADLVAALGNSLNAQGFRAIVFGPQPKLERPAWLTDPSVLTDKLQRHFDGAIMPALELFKRTVGYRGEADILVLTACAETPYVTKDAVGGKWVVRVRANTQRRTARRVELLRLCGHGTPTHVSSMRIGLARASKMRWLLRLHNTGQTVVRSIELHGACPFIDPVAWTFGQQVIEELRPGEEGSVQFHASKRSAFGESCRLTFRGRDENDDPVEATYLLHPHALTAG